MVESAVLFKGGVNHVSEVLYLTAGPWLQALSIRVEQYDGAKAAELRFVLQDIDIFCQVIFSKN